MLQRAASVASASAYSFVMQADIAPFRGMLLGLFFACCLDFRKADGAAGQRGLLQQEGRRRFKGMATGIIPAGPRYISSRRSFARPERLSQKKKLVGTCFLPCLDKVTVGFSFDLSVLAGAPSKKGAKVQKGHVAGSIGQATLTNKDMLVPAF